MCRRRMASDTAHTDIAQATSEKKAGLPPASSAHAPAYVLKIAPERPIADPTPTPVERTPVGYTCAASANIVVWTALISPPVIASMMMMGMTGLLEVITIDLMTSAPAMAPAVIVSMVPF